jgi:hypothetical protein
MESLKIEVITNQLAGELRDRVNDNFPIQMVNEMLARSDSKKNEKLLK